MKWANQLKIAIIERDEVKIEKAIEKLPNFDSLEEMKEAAYLMQEAHNFLSSQKEEFASKLLKIKKQKEFLNATIQHPSSFDQSL